jgi:hypothetical protein
MTRFIDGLHNTNHRARLLEQLQGKNTILLDECVQMAQQLEMISCFEKVEASTSFISHVDKNRHIKSHRGNNMCGACGYQHERSAHCPAIGKTCNSCKGRNHFAKMCKRNGGPSHHVAKDERDSDLEDTAVYTIQSSNQQNTIQNVKIDGVELPMQLDTGSQATLIPNNFWHRLGEPRLKKTNVRLKQFDGSVIGILGQFTALLESDSKIKVVDIAVAKCDKSHGLIGTDVLKFDTTAISIHTNSLCLGEDIGCLKNFRARLLLRESSKPCYFEARELPIHLKPKVIAKLHLMIAQGILERVPPGGSRWASPIVVVRKPDGDVRICSDYKVGLNEKLCSDSYPIPRIETAFSAMAEMKVYAKFDLSGAYNQLVLDEESRELTTINTPLGLLRWTRLPYGVKTASAQFQAAIESILSDEMPNRIIYQDDIAIGAKSEVELARLVETVLTKLKDAGLKINENKCVYKTDKLSFLGHVVTDGKVTPDPDLVNKIVSLSAPSDRKSLLTFLGLVNFYGRYIERLTDIMEPLAALRSKDTIFQWGERQQMAFEKIKSLLCQYPVVHSYDVNKHTELTTDASENGIAGVLSQEGHPIMYLSRRLTSAERNYSNIEREALAIVWCTFRARHFLIGSRFTLKCDHQPLEYIFHPRRELPKVTSARILRWAIQLMGFDYEIQYVKGSTIPHADALSRLECQGGDDKGSVRRESSEDFVHWLGTDVVDFDVIRSDSQSDSVLSSVMHRVSSGRWSNCSQAERAFKSVRQRLSIEDGILYNGDVMVPPDSLRNAFIGSVHDDVHCGVSATRSRLRLEAWWPGYCGDVESYVGQCAKCSEIKVVCWTVCQMF